jgi:uncharacterized membrane protein
MNSKFFFNFFSRETRRAKGAGKLRSRSASVEHAGRVFIAPSLRPIVFGNETVTF